MKSKCALFNVLKEQFTEKEQFCHHVSFQSCTTVSSVKRETRHSKNVQAALFHTVKVNGDCSSCVFDFLLIIYKSTTSEDKNVKYLSGLLYNAFIAHICVLFGA